MRYYIIIPTVIAGVILGLTGFLAGNPIPSVESLPTNPVFEERGTWWEHGEYITALFGIVGVILGSGIALLGEYFKATRERKD